MKLDCHVNSLQSAYLRENPVSKTTVGKIVDFCFCSPINELYISTYMT